VIHRDVKPENVLVVEREGELRAKLMDFGLARIDKDTAVVDEDVFHTVATNVVSGSPPYLSPEQVLGEALDRRTDLYSVGVVLFEMLTGVLPFNASTLAGYIRAHVGRPAPRLAERLPGVDFHPVLESFVARLLAKKATDRFPDARSVLGEIELTILPALTPSTELAVTVDEEPPPGAGNAAAPDQRGITRILGRLFAKKNEPRPGP
jgi:serine/threonine-protein kinase